LLIVEVFVGSDKDFEALAFGYCKKVAVAQRTPTTLKSSFHSVRA
jgi:hypothetical protein